MQRVAYFGPAGTFTEEALLTQADLAAGKRTPFGSVPDVIAAVERGEVDGGVVPIENMIEGSVSITLDTLAFESELLIQREIDLPVSLNLCAPPGVSLADIRTVVSFPHAIAQCRGWLSKKLPAAESRSSHSTSDAAREVSRSKRRDYAAICNALAADLYGLEVLATDVEDHPENETRFVLVGRGIPAPTGHDKTSIVCFQRQDRPGSLLGILQEYAARDVNLTKLESRPTKQGLGDYCFFIDCEGHLADELVADALRNLAAKHGDVKFLGSYPVGGPAEAGAERRRAVGKAWKKASGWVDSLRAQIRDDGVIDLKRLRDEPEYRRGVERKRVRDGLIDDVIGAFGAESAVRQETEALRAEQNKASKEIGKAAPDERQAKIEAAAAMKAELQQTEVALAAAEGRLRELALQVPNPAAADVPDGGEEDFVVVRTIGETTPAPPLDHAAFAEAIGFVDTARGAEASGSRFAYVMREAVLIEFALVQWVMKRLVDQGFAPVVPPVLVRERTMEEAGFFPTDRAQVYEVDGGELFLTGTSEVPLSVLRRGDLLDPDELPARYAGFSSNFRREAGTYGKDTRGIFRVHQFDKIEMFSYCDPSESWDEHDRLVAIEESILTDLGLPYRVINVAAGDLGPAAAKKYDIEVWLPSEGRYRESHSCSNYLEFSTRRLNTRVRSVDGNQLAHTLNGTACAIGRTLVFLFEHYQDAAGGFTVPEVLRPFTGFERVEPRK